MHHCASLCLIVDVVVMNISVCWFSFSFSFFSFSSLTHCSSPLLFLLNSSFGVGCCGFFGCFLFCFCCWVFVCLLLLFWGMHAVTKHEIVIVTIKYDLFCDVLLSLMMACFCVFLCVCFLIYSLFYVHMCRSVLVNV